MFQFTRLSLACSWIQQAVQKVDLFGNLRIYAYFQLPEAFRRLLRPSSSLGAIDLHLQLSNPRNLISIQILIPIPSVMAAALFSTSLSPRFLALSSPKPAATVASAFLPFRLPLRAVSAPGRRVFEPVAVAVSSEYETEGAEQEEEGAEEFSEDLKLFVGNLPFSVDSAQLAGLFEQAGSVEMVEVVYDRMTGRSRGFGFVTMSSAEEAGAAVEQFNGYTFQGRPLRVNSGPPPPRDDSAPRAPRGGGGGGNFVDSGNKVYVGNLSWGVDNSTLENLFSEQGQVLDAKVIYDRESGRSRGFGFVTYGSAEEVNNAISNLDGIDLDGRQIRVTVAESKPRRQF